MVVFACFHIIIHYSVQSKVQWDFQDSFSYSLWFSFTISYMLLKGKLTPMKCWWVLQGKETPMKWVLSLSLSLYTHTSCLIHTHTHLLSNNITLILMDVMQARAECSKDGVECKEGNGGSEENVFENEDYIYTNSLP